MATAQAAIERLCDPQYEVSAHYVIAEDGAVTQLVAEEMRAWHAGAGAWGDIVDINSHSIGIELANHASDGVFPPFPEPQMRALEALLRAVMARWNISAHAVLGHSDTAPGRKSDPGPKFDWSRLERGAMAAGGKPHMGSCAGNSERSPEKSCDPEKFYGDLHKIGYRGTRSDLLAAFRLRYNRVDTGAVDAIDCAQAAARADLTLTMSKR